MFIGVMKGTGDFNYTVNAEEFAPRNMFFNLLPVVPATDILICDSQAPFAARDGLGVGRGCLEPLGPATA